MNRYESIKTLTIDEMAKAIMKLSADCSDCEGGCVIGDNDCFKCTKLRLREQLEDST